LPTPNGELPEATRLGGRVGLHHELALGRRGLSERFRSARPRIIRPNEALVGAVGSRDVIYRVRAGWAGQFHDLSNGHRAIVDIYLPGDVIGLDTALQTRPLKEVLALTSVTIEAIHAEDALIDLMVCRPTALYIAWLLAQRQRRIDRLLAAISCLDARGRLATMVLQFYTRLRRKRLITGSIYNLPLTQTQIGSYLGLTVVHVNRVLRSLRDERIIQVEKHCVTILDLARLMNLAHHAETVSSIAHIGERSSENGPLDQPNS
jgi:CRP/FNR family transcriptional regulator